MATITATTTIDASPERVWEVLSDFGGISQAAPYIKASRLTSDDSEGVGTSRHCDFAMPGLSTEETVTRWDDGNGLGIDVQMNGMPMRKTHAEFELATIDGSKTMLTGVMTYSLPFGPIGRAMNRLAGRKMGSMWAGMMAGYKQRAESGTEVGQDTPLPVAAVEIAYG